MQRNLELQIQLQTMSETVKETPLNYISDPALWTGAFNTSLLTTRANALRDTSRDLSTLMKTTEFECLLLAAQQLSAKENISADEATERLIHVFRQIDKSWKQIVISRGLKSLTESV